ARVHVHCDGRTLGRVIRVPGNDSLNGAIQEHHDSIPRAPGRATPASPMSLRRTPTTPLPDAAPETERLSHDSRPGSVPAAASSTDASYGTLASTNGRDGAAASSSGNELISWNGHGGLTPGDDYEIHVRGDSVPPAPWINVIANPKGGFIVSERGAGSCWSGNSYFYRITPWHNDPVSDPPGDVLYLRDEDSGELWCPTPAPVLNARHYTVVHSAASTTFHHIHNGIRSVLQLGVPKDDPVKVSVLRLTNEGATTRRLTLTAYAEWTLGVNREHTQHQVQTKFDAELGAIMARNTFDPQFADYAAFLTFSEPVRTFTADRRDFLGRNGSIAYPAALRMYSRDSMKLSEEEGAALDPCAALQCAIELAPGETREIVVAL